MPNYPITRKVFHVLGGALLVIAYSIFVQAYGKAVALFAATVLLFSFLIFDGLRMAGKISTPFKEELFKESEKQTLNASTYLILGFVVCFALFEFRIALIAFAMLILGDTSAALVGKRWGRHSISGTKKKITWEGFLAGLGVNLIVGLVIWPRLAVILPMGIAASLTEATSSKIDDNLTVPVVAGLVGQLVVVLL